MMSGPERWDSAVRAPLYLRNAQGFIARAAFLGASHAPSHR
jgi:hypothetical protein